MKGKQRLICSVIAACLWSFCLIFLLGCDQEPDNQIWQRAQKAIKSNPSHLEGGALLDISKLVNRRSQYAEKLEVVDALVMTGAYLLDDNAKWTDTKQARRVYDIIKELKEEVATEALVRNVLKTDHRLQVLFLGIKLGIPGSEEKLISALMEHGDKMMAEDYLNSGSSKLHDGGRKWANMNGYLIRSGLGSDRAGWGQF